MRKIIASIIYSICLPLRLLLHSWIFDESEMFLASQLAGFMSKFLIFFMYTTFYMSCFFKERKVQSHGAFTHLSKNLWKDIFPSLRFFLVYILHILNSAVRVTKSIPFFPCTYLYVYDNIHVGWYLWCWKLCCVCVFTDKWIHIFTKIFV